MYQNKCASDKHSSFYKPKLHEARSKRNIPRSISHISKQVRFKSNQKSNQIIGLLSLLQSED